MASDNTASWSLEDLALTNLHDAIIEFEETNGAAIEEARDKGTPCTFVLENKLEEMMKDLIKDLRSRYPTATFRVGHPIIVFTSRKHVPIPGFTKTAYVVLKNSNLKTGTIQWGEDMGVIGEGYYILFAMK